MLDIFKEEQSLFCEEINNSIKNGKISHAFLIETNDYLRKDELILAFIKLLFKNSSNTEDEFENISNLIDNNACADFMIIEPDGAFIKKEQIQNLKEKFKTTTEINRPRIYWIKDADKLNKYAANSLLKFLEEPEGNIIAILETNNRYKIMETIRSRCQIYSFINLFKDKMIDYNEKTISIVEILEKYKKKSIAYLNMELDNDLKNKEYWLEIFNNMIDIYEKALRKKENINLNANNEIINYIVDNNTLQELINKIDVLFTTIKNLDYNLNIAMMLDKFLIEFTGGER